MPDAARLEFLIKRTRLGEFRHFDIFLEAVAVASLQHTEATFNVPATRDSASRYSWILKAGSKSEGSKG